MGAARRAARLADVFLPSKAEFWEPYRQAVVEAGGPDWGPMPAIGPRYVAIHDDPDVGWAEVARHVAHDRAAYGSWAAAAGAATGFEGADAVADRDDPEYRVVTPAGFRSLVADLGPHGTLAVHPMMGGLPPEHAWTNLQRLADALGLEPG